MTSLLKKLSIFIKIGVIKRYRVCWSVSKLSTESVGSRRELVPNCVHTADSDATKQFRRVGVGGVYWALHWLDIVSLASMWITALLLFFKQNRRGSLGFHAVSIFSRD